MPWDTTPVVRRKMPTIVGPLWVHPSGPPRTITSAMTSIHRTFRTPRDPMNALSFHGKEGVVGSNPTEGLAF